LVLLGASCAALGWTPAHAQGAPQEPPSDDQVAPQERVEDIVVTARRKPEPLQRVPISVVALTGKDLESRSVTNLRSLQNFVPNLTFAASQNVGEAGGNAFIRGIGQEDFGVGADPGVGFYVDGVYFARTIGTIMNITDVERIEVLRGPQGTLFGKNTIGGVINIITAQPKPDREQRSSIILGTYARAELRAVVNEPLSGNLFVRASIGAVSRNGYLRRLPSTVPAGVLEQLAPVDLDREGNDRNLAGRLQLRWLIGASLTADLAVDGSVKRNHQGAIHLDAIDPDAGDFPDINRLIREGRLPGPEISGALVTDDLLESHATGHNRTDLDVWGASAVLTKRIGGNTITFIGAYRGLRSRIGTDTDGIYFDVFERDLRANERQLTGELQWTGTSGALSYTAGLFAFDERSKLLPTADVLMFLYRCGCYYTPDDVAHFTADVRDLRTTSAAGYTQGTYRIGEKLSLTGGARYSLERKGIDGRAFLLDANLNLTDELVAVASNRGRWSSLTYHAGAEYQATPLLMGYASVAKGFKSGGFNVRSDITAPGFGYARFRPETALTVELGVRSEWLHRRLKVNATVFHTAYRDIQLRQQSIVNGEFTTLIENAARARIRGAEVEVEAIIAPGLTVRGAYGHLDPRYLDVGRVPGLTLDSRFQRTPSHSLNVSVDFEKSLRQGIVELHGAYSFRSKEQFQITPAINDQEGYGLLSARLTLRTRDNRWSFALFGTNLTDLRYRTAGRGTLLHQAGVAFSSVGLPRQIGLQLDRRF
jgi:iron complex outermembrane recepter protein